MKFKIVCAIIMAGSHFALSQNSAVLPKPAHGFHAFPDSIRLEFQDQGAFVVFQFKSLTGATDQVDSFFKDFGQLLQRVEKSIPDTSTPHHVDVRQLPGQEMTIEIHETVPSTRLIIHEKEVIQLLPPGWEFNIHSKQTEIYAYAQQWEQLKTIAGYHPEVPIQLLKGSQSTISIGRKRMIARMIVQHDSVIYKDIKYQMPEDFIVGTASSGLGYLGDTFYPELNASVTLRFGDHFNRKSQKVTFTYNNLFFMQRTADGGLTPKINSFGSVTWSKNLDGSGKFFGLGAGYLIHRSGDYFKGKTLKFFITKDVGGFNVAPEFYLTNDFKNFQMGIRFNYTF